MKLQKVALVPRKSIARYIIHRAQLLGSIGRDAEIHWLPRYIRVEGNETTDKTAKVNVENPSTRRCTKRFT